MTFPKPSLRLFLLSAVALLAPMITGCSRSIILLSPEDQFALGNYYLEEGKPGKATEQFEKIRTDYPTSQYANIGQLKLAQALFARKKYDEAAIDFSLFLEFHPAHKMAPYAQYHLAMSKFRSMLNPERDTTLAKEALIEFDKYIQNYPNGEELQDALKYRAQTEDHLLRHEFDVGKVYYRRKAYQSAIGRLKNIPEKAHDLQLRQSSLFYLGICYERKKEVDSAKEAYKKACEIDSSTELAQKAQKRLTQIKSE